MEIAAVRRNIMGLDMYFIKRPKGKDIGGIEVGYWRKDYDMQNYFLSNLPIKTDMDEYSFVITKEELKKFRSAFIDLLKSYETKKTEEDIYEYYKKVFNLENYDDYNTEHISLRNEFIKNILLRTLGIIDYNLETCDFDKYDLYYEYSC